MRNICCNSSSCKSDTSHITVLHNGLTLKVESIKFLMTLINYLIFDTGLHTTVQHHMSGISCEGDTLRRVPPFDKFISRVRSHIEMGVNCNDSLILVVISPHGPKILRKPSCGFILKPTALSLSAMIALNFPYNTLCSRVLEYPHTFALTGQHSI